MRGQLEMSQVVGIVFVIAAALVLFTFWYRWSASVTGANAVENCRLSVENLAYLWLDLPDVLSNDFHLTALDCQRRSILFTEKDVRLNGKRMKYYDPRSGKSKSVYRQLTPDIVNSVVASELATCWYEMLEGKMYFMNRIDINNNWVSCFICSEIRFDPALDAQKVGTSDFLSFLDRRSRPYPRGVAGHSAPSYKEYLYLSEHICDHSGKSEFGVNNWFDLDEEWYDPNDKRSCEQQFYDKILFGEHGVQYPDGGFSPLMYYLNPDHTPGSIPAFEGLSIDKSYLVIFFQLGADRGKNDNGEPIGATYAPIVIPTSAFGTTLQCDNFLG